MPLIVPSKTVILRRPPAVTSRHGEVCQLAPKPPWWLWPHLLSLDAPLVAVVWQNWWARVAGVRLSWVHVVLLGAGVWLIYLADRLADTATDAAPGHDTSRHAFYRRHRRAITPIALGIFLGLAWLAPRYLPPKQLLAGLSLLTLAGGYFWVIHACERRGWPRFLPKEAVVGGMFMIGTAFFVHGGATLPPSEWGAAALMFGTLCFFNCAVITKWERTPRDLRDSSSLLNAFPRLTARLGVSCLGLTALALAAVAIMPHGRVFAPLAFSALLLASMDWRHDLFSTDALRVLADMVLLTPLIFR